MISAVLEQVRAFVETHPAVEVVVWFLGAVACIALLVWFLLFSGYGAPPEFIYDQF